MNVPKCALVIIGFPKMSRSWCPQMSGTHCVGDETLGRWDTGRHWETLGDTGRHWDPPVRLHDPLSNHFHWSALLTMSEQSAQQKKHGKIGLSNNKKMSEFSPVLVFLAPFFMTLKQAQDTTIN